MTGAGGAGGDENHDDNGDGGGGGGDGGSGESNNRCDTFSGCATRKFPRVEVDAYQTGQIERRYPLVARDTACCTRDQIWHSLPPGNRGVTLINSPLIGCKPSLQRRCHSPSAIL